MKSSLFAALIVLLPLAAAAEPKPYRAINGRASPLAAARPASPSNPTLSALLGESPSRLANTPSKPGSGARSRAYARGRNRGAIQGQSGPRGGTMSPTAVGSLRGRGWRIDGGEQGGDHGGGQGGEEEPRPPYLDRKGAFIRTEGLGYKSSDGTLPVVHAWRTHEPQVVATIGIDAATAVRVSGIAAISYAKPDKAPPCTPILPGCGGNSGSSGGNSITPNSD